MLYFICPTDNLETIIENKFSQENYFYSSLGNSVTFRGEELRQTKKLIQTKNINEVSFVLSYDNCMVVDALNNQNFANVRGLNSFFHQIISKKESVEISWKTTNSRFLILSYFLHEKIKEFKKSLNDTMIDRLTVFGKIYDKNEEIFYDISSRPIWTESIILN